MDKGEQEIPPKESDEPNVIVESMEAHDGTAEALDHEVAQEDEEDPNVHLDLPTEWRYHRNHPRDGILGDPAQQRLTRSQLHRMVGHFAFVSQFEPKHFDDAHVYEFWFMAMQGELNQFERNKVWNLVPRPTHQSIIGTKWIFRNKLDEFGNVVRNKARLVAQGYNQQEGIDFDETFAPFA